MADDDYSLGDAYRDLRDESQRKRAENRAWSTNFLREQGIEYRSNNGGEHLMIDQLGRRIDFWPGTGKWILRGGEKDESGRGVRNLVARIRSLKMIEDANAGGRR